MIKIMSELAMDLPTPNQRPKTGNNKLKNTLGSYHNVLYGLIVIVVIAVLTNAFLSSSIHDPFSKTQEAALGIPLYYPTKLPSGYHIDYKSVNQPAGGVITFVIDGPTSNRIYVSEEVAPSSDTVDTLTGSITKPITISTSLGKGVMGRLASGQGEVATVLTNNKTWVIANYSSDTQTISNLELILQNLTVSN